MIWFIAALCIVFVLIAALVRRRPKAATQTPKSVIVDGSNVMHWDGEPSEAVLLGVIKNLQDQGLSPIVIFDANVGYKLREHFLDGPMLARICGLRAQNVVVMDTGIVADIRILEMAQASRLKVVSNDRYQDWSAKFPFVKKRGRMMRGAWKGGTVVWAKK